MTKTLLDHTRRFWSKVDRSGTCWVWTAWRTAKGYGRFDYQGQSRLAHRWIYELCRGPAGPCLDHLCRNRACVRPSHMEAVTRAENTRRGINFWGSRDRCSRGHVYADHPPAFHKHKSENRIERACRPCMRERDRKRKAANRLRASRLRCDDWYILA